MKLNYKNMYKYFQSPMHQLHSIPLVVLSHMLIGLYAYSPICDIYYVTCNGMCNGVFFINKDYKKSCEQMSLFPLVL